MVYLEFFGQKKFLKKVMIHIEKSWLKRDLFQFFEFLWNKQRLHNLRNTEIADFWWVFLFTLYLYAVQFLKRSPLCRRRKCVGFWYNTKITKSPPTHVLHLWFFYTTKPIDISTNTEKIQERRCWVDSEIAYANTKNQ